MKKNIILVFLSLVYVTFLSSCVAQKSTKPHIVFVIGDEEYRSEESMPMLGRILKRELGAKITLCYPLDSSGTVNPNVINNIAGLKALETADLMVVFARWRELPRTQATYITNYAESGKPMVGFRTATHTFKYNTDSAMFYLNNEWPTKVFGQQWITHHGHFDDGAQPLTAVYEKATESSPILNGFESFDAYSWLYHVDGGDWKLSGNPTILLEGKSLKSNHQMNNKLDQFPLTNPVAWTKTYAGNKGETARVFFTTLGHPYDFRHKSMRKLALNGIYWALEMEDKIPANGVNDTVVGQYAPNNSGFGSRFKKNMEPEQIED